MGGWVGGGERGDSLLALCMSHLLKPKYKLMWNMTNFIHCTHFIIIDDITRCDIIRIQNTLKEKC